MQTWETWQRLSSSDLQCFLHPLIEGQRLKTSLLGQHPLTCYKVMRILFFMYKNTYVKTQIIYTRKLQTRPPLKRRPACLFFFTPCNRSFLFYVHTYMFAVCTHMSSLQIQRFTAFLVNSEFNQFATLDRISFPKVFVMRDYIYIDFFIEIQNKVFPPQT